MKHIISFSGGAGSAIAAELAVNEYGKENVVLLFADSLIEDKSLYLFNSQVSEALGVGLTVITEGRTPWQVFKDVKYQGNTRIDPCSRVLKRDFIRKWLKLNYNPNQCNIHVGIDCTEEHRLGPVVERNKPFIYRSMLIEKDMFITNDDKVKWCLDNNITVPVMYELGFAHNNCCVKAGLGQFKKLYEKLPDVYLHHEAQQEQLMIDVPNVHPFLRKRKNKVLRYLTLREYRLEFLENGDTEGDDFEVGGCGCAL